jgi:hypothetical protein
MAGDEDTEAGSGTAPQNDQAAAGTDAGAPETVDAKAGDGAKPDASVKSDASRKPDQKSEGKKAKVKEEAQPAVTAKPVDAPPPEPPAVHKSEPAAAAPQPSQYRSLAEVMKVDLRPRRKRHY